nr:MAG TPA_asm: hypothetical protein [Caudoviricetes sp.]DAQ34823.1 MAG TPA: hypothetical protein [Caudoviricetes sp.]DAT88831.1 MAG TPA: hypothetical protein [Caudoviricetes sp.]DAY84082.1 MAG TPA: hypothetical protein [Caudoviricetes sp.]
MSSCFVTVFGRCYAFLRLIILYAFLRKCQ